MTFLNITNGRYDLIFTKLDYSCVHASLVGLSCKLWLWQCIVLHSDMHCFRWESWVWI